MIEIIPNWHPFLVHYTIALLSITAVFYALRKVTGRDSLQAAGDWCLAAGMVFIGLTVLAGFQAYNTLDHDGPSHLAMTGHRNWAIGTSVLWGVIAVWRGLTRSATVHIGLVVLSLVGAVLWLGVGYRGAELVYHHGLGVERLPEAYGEGHDHEHADGDGHDQDDNSAQSSSEEIHDHNDHDHSEEEGASSGEETASTEFEVQVHDDASSDEPDLTTPDGTVDAFHAALRSGDETTVEALLGPDVVIFEGGGSERSFEEYASHHMGADMAFVSQMNSTVLERDVLMEGDTARVLTEGRMTGTYNEREYDEATLETIILERSGEGWRIVHIHWS